MGFFKNVFKATFGNLSLWYSRGSPFYFKEPKWDKEKNMMMSNLGLCQSKFLQNNYNFLLCSFIKFPHRRQKKKSKTKQNKKTLSGSPAPNELSRSFDIQSSGALSTAFPFWDFKPLRSSLSLYQSF